MNKFSLILIGIIIGFSGLYCWDNFHVLPPNKNEEENIALRKQAEILKANNAVLQDSINRMRGAIQHKDSILTDSDRKNHKHYAYKRNIANSLIATGQDSLLSDLLRQLPEKQDDQYYLLVP